MSDTELRFPTRTAAVNTETLVRGYSRIPEVLASMGYDGLRPGQEEPILNILGQRDAIVILPTGTGKTACFVVPTLCLDWKTLVFSPLVALMRDQVQGLWRLGIRAGQMSGTQTEAENMSAVRQWMAGELQLFYVAPERLGNAMFQEAIRCTAPDMVVLDEAHTLSQWSDNFRPAYCAVGDFIANNNPKVVTAFTATAPQEVEDDVRRVLGLQAAQKFMHYPRRTNLKLMSTEWTDMMSMATLIGSIDGPVIVYCATIQKGVEDVAAKLSTFLGDQVTIYHGDLDPATKRTNQDMFMTDRVKVMVATNAFGMGIDKPNIRGIIHYDFPGSVEAMVQETGRGGRDGGDCICMAYTSPRAQRTQEFFISCAYPPKEDVEALFDTLKRSVNDEGITHLTGEEMAKKSGINGFTIRAAVSVLMGGNIIERAKADTKIAKVRFVGNSEEDRFQDWKRAIETGGEEDEDGFICFDLNWLVDKIQLSYATVTKYLREWDKNGLIRYVAPFRGSPTRVLSKDLRAIDFDRLHKKKLDARRKLSDVLDYLGTPDVDKHAFTEEYFQVHRK